VGKKGIIKRPPTSTIAPIIKYAFLKRQYRAETLSLSPSTMGLYIQKEIAEPMPSSATSKNPIMLK
jgi:hypothetical protein